ncbi:monocarboxylate transporter 7 [Drosophila nasuta]|uniref:monocarboxylate transporter 7 n=1 Tax=Drosophila nasuta TaxID=42062 RepID=UPI00295EB4A8|nr:monocarboxylate transporter 7 [Drosophila nasuta]
MQQQQQSQQQQQPARHCHGTNLNSATRFPLQATAKQRHCDNFGSYATLPSIEHQQQPQQQQQQIHHAPCSRHCTAAAAATLPPHPEPAARWYAASTVNPNPCCYMYNPTPHYAPPLCLCDNWYHQQQHQQQQHQQQQHHLHHQRGFPAAPKPFMPNGGCYLGFEGHHPSHITDEEDSAFPALADREFHLLHRNIPALRRTGVDTTRIRQYFYPDGGWGWIICGVSFLVHILTTGLQLSYGLLLFYAVQHLHNTSGIELLGALSWSISMLAIPFVVSLCRKRSIRLLSIVGGLVMPLGILFTSFATEFGQVVFSYGIVFGIGVSMVREASTVMLGNYFKRRRQFVEMVAMSGEGVGIALFSVILKEGVGKAGWRLGLQIVAALTALSFFMGLMYRPASLYHPQRRAIQHLKNQRKKLREKKPKLTHEVESPSRYLFLDISSLKSVTVKILLMTSSVAAFGIYTPMFLMALNAAKEGSDVQELVLLQTFLGISMALGVVLAGALLRRCFVIKHFVINTKIVTQLFIAIVALAILFLSFVMGYKGLCILSWLYGIGLGGFQYSLKILALERIKLKHFSKAWGFIRGVESVPVLISVPLTSFLNDYSLKYGRAGYYICSAAAAISGIIIFFITEPQEQQQQQQQQQQQRGHLNGHLPTPMLMRHSSARHHRPQLAMDYGGYGEYPAPDLLSRSCMSLNQMEPYLQANNSSSSNYCQRHMHHQQQQQLPPPPPPQQSHGHQGLHQHLQQQQQHHHMTPQHHPQQLTCHNLDMQQTRSPYQLGQGSIGAKMGKRLQRSLSFIQQHNCCDGQMYCSWHSTYELGCRKSPKSQDRQQLICTCSSPPSTTYGGVGAGSSARSRSVPEGLSTMSQQCNCRHGAGVPTAAPSREFIYVPHAYASLQRTPHRQSRQTGGGAAAAGTGAGAGATGATNSGCSATSRNPQCRLKRSQSLCRPVHFVEQITTSV